jgi:Baseplate J-like protein
MQAVENEVETVHLYVVREHEKKPYTLLPLLCALVCLLGIVAVTFYSAEHPFYEHERLTVPAVALPPKVFTAHTPIIPTGIETYPATTARGVLTITNGSVIVQSLPVGLMLVSNNGIAVATDAAVVVPAGSADGYGEATVDAHAVASGKRGNLATLTINSVEGTSLYIRNLSAFTGGKDSRTVTFATAQDKQTALLQARGILLNKSTGLHYPCGENYIGDSTKMVLTWRCRFVNYHIPTYMHVTSVQLIGKQVVLSVWYLPPIRQVRTK